jgi:hypothetical protein
MSQLALPDGRDYDPVEDPIEQTLFAQLQGAGPLGSGLTPPGDWGPLEPNVYKSLAATNLFVKYGHRSDLVVTLLSQLSNLSSNSWQQH